MFWQHGRLLKDIDQVNDLNLSFHYHLKISGKIKYGALRICDRSSVILCFICWSLPVYWHYFRVLAFYILQYIFIRFIHLIPITNRMNTEYFGITKQKKMKKKFSTRKAIISRKRLFGHFVLSCKELMLTKSTRW